MPETKWYPFDTAKGYRQKRPPIKKLVLVQIRSNDDSSPDPICVGYRKDAAGDKRCPYFVIPGIGEQHGPVYRWRDCLPYEAQVLGFWGDGRHARISEIRTAMKNRKGN